MTDQPTTEAGRALLTELSESPLPGARYAHEVVGRRLLAIEAEARAAERQRVEALEEALGNIKDTFNRDNIRPGTAAFLMYEEALRALASPAPAAGVEASWPFTVWEPPAPLSERAVATIYEAFAQHTGSEASTPAGRRLIVEPIYRAVRAVLTATEQETGEP